LLALPRSAERNVIWEFSYSINGQAADMMFTSVAGHLMELDFTPAFKSWRGCVGLGRV
jgi:DNA topoisomerase-3